MYECQSLYQGGENRVRINRHGTVPAGPGSFAPLTFEEMFFSNDDPVVQRIETAWRRAQTDQPRGIAARSDPALNSPSQSDPI